MTPASWVCHQVPAALAELRELQPLYKVPHLPQGAPTSPALAKLCAYRLDCRFNGLAEAFEATYTRYADDLESGGSTSLRSRNSP